MAKVLLTGGSGFIASHILDVLLQRDYTVVTSVRSQGKANKIKANHPNAGDKLQFVIVEDIAKPDAFDDAVISEPPFDFVIHTASPFHLNATDAQKDLLDPAVNGTVGVLKAIKRSAPTVKRVVVTSSFAAIVDPVRKPPNYHYSEKDWNGVTLEEAIKDPGSTGYRASKTFAERAAWEFVERNGPSFELITMNPPMVFGPIHPGLQSIESLNTSNERIRDMMKGALKDKITPSPIVLWVDVRDLAKAHVNALEKEEAAGKRFFIVEGLFSNQEIADTIKKNLPEFADKLPSDTSSGGLPPPDKRQGFDNSRAKEILGLNFTSLEQSITDAAKSIATIM